MSKKGSNTTTSSSAPDPQAYAAYSSLLNRASGVASTPYQPYGGELVAPVNAQQQTGINNINQSAGFAQPYIQQASQYANQAAQPLTAQQIAQYQSPYTQQVVDATQAQFSNQNAQQQNALVGNAASQGALGGDRVGVAQAQLAGQQNLSQAPVIAGLYNQGYSTALQTGLAEQQNLGNAAYSLGNLGVAGQGAALQGAGAQVGAGSLQQGTQQAQDVANYGQFQQQQAFPYQQAQWLAGIDTGVGSQLGGTSQTTAPAPSPLGQIAGLGLAGVGLVGGTGGFGANGWLSGMFSKDGGRIPHRDSGGGIGGTPYAGVAGYVPQFNITGGRGAPAPPSAHAASTGIPGLGNLNSLFKGWNTGQQQGSNNLSTDQPDNGTGIYTGPAWQPGFGYDANPGTASNPLAGLTADDYGFRRGGFVRGYDDGGPVSMAGFGMGSIVPPTFDDRFSGAPPDPAWINPAFDYRRAGFGTGAPSGPLAFADRAQPAQDAIENGDFDPQGMNYTAFAPGESQASPQRAAAVEGPEPGFGSPAPASSPAGLAPEETQTADASDDAELPENATLTEGQAPDGGQQSGFGISPAGWAGITAAGLGMLASRSPHPGVAIGEGGLQGLQTYSQTKAAEQKAVTENRKIELESKKLSQAAEQAAARLKQQAKTAEETADYHKALLTRDTQKPVKIGVDPLGQEILGIRDPKNPGKFLNPITGKPVETSSPIMPPLYRVPEGATAPTSKATPNGASPDDESALPPNATPVQQHADGTNPEVLQQLPPEIANKVRGIAEGRQSLQSVPMHQRTAVQNLVNAYDPSFDQSMWTARSAMNRDLAVGNTGKLVLASNQLLPHLKTASDKAEALKNTNYPAANTVANWWLTQTGDPRVKEFETVRTVAATDAARLLRGSGAMAHEEIRGWEDRLKNAGSPAQLQGVLSMLGDDLLGARMSSIEHQYEMVMHKKPPELMSKEAKEALSVLRSRSPENVAASKAPPAGSIPGTKDGAKVWKTPDGQYIPRAQ